MFYPRFIGMPRLRAWQPFEELDRMRRQMDRIMDEFAGRPSMGLSAGVFPAINLTEDDANYYVRAELPGVASKDLEIQATGRNLTISGKRELDFEPGKAKFHRREREAGEFSRVLAMPKEIESQRVEAHLSNGILTLRVPKAESAKPKKITIGS
ncbi:MAG: Hsp20/alpha crystallin family protein [Desulfosarcinaceae bacterium]